jgi:hypothetical protein
VFVIKWRYETGKFFWVIPSVHPGCGRFRKENQFQARYQAAKEAGKDKPNQKQKLEDFSI